MVIDVCAGRLDDEDVFVTDGLRDLHVDFSVGEFDDGAWCEGDVESEMLGWMMWGRGGVPWGFVQRQSSSGERDCSPLSHRLGELRMAIPYVHVHPSEIDEN